MTNPFMLSNVCNLNHYIDLFNLGVLSSFGILEGFSGFSGFSSFISGRSSLFSGFISDKKHHYLKNFEEILYQIKKSELK